jgi:lysylphosphatidylglycerol synthetase-like protein (DUF2156 family)
MAFQVRYDKGMKNVLLAAVLLLVPVVSLANASAQATAQAASFVAIFNRVILFPTIALLSAIALLVFIFGCFQYIAMANNEQARTQGVKHITWGIVGLVVMLSAYSILTIVTATFGLDDELDSAQQGQPVIPTQNFQSTINNSGNNTIDNSNADNSLNN